MNADKLAQALRAFPEDPNPFTYRRAYAKAQAALAEYDAQPAQAAQPVCQTCNGAGIVGGISRQTPEQYEARTENCPDCTAKPRNALPSRDEILDCARNRDFLDGGEYMDSMRDMLRNIADGLPQSQPVGVPDGWVMVPKRDVTSDMIRVGMEWITNCQTDFDRACMVTCIFGEMCKVAPQPSADAEDGL